MRHAWLGNNYDYCSFKSSIHIGGGEYRIRWILYLVRILYLSIFYILQCSRNNIYLFFLFLKNQHGPVLMSPPWIFPARHPRKKNSADTYAWSYNAIRKKILTEIIIYLQYIKTTIIISYSHRTLYKYIYIIRTYEYIKYTDRIIIIIITHLHIVRLLVITHRSLNEFVTLDNLFLNYYLHG